MTLRDELPVGIAVFDRQTGQFVRGTVGPDDRAVVAVFTLHPPGTEYEKAYAEVTRLTGRLSVPGVPDRR